MAHSFALKILRRLKYQLLDAPRGFGRPVATPIWDDQFRGGAWDHLYSTREIAHYMLLLGFLRQLRTGPPAVLDAGCGNGRLLDLLRREDIGRYVGVDVSRAAIERARDLGVPSELHVAAFEEWRPDGAFDFVIFNESLYYAREPVTVLARYRAALRPGGAFLVSMCHYGNHARIWRSLARTHECLGAATVENEARQRWTVRALKPLP